MRPMSFSVRVTGLLVAAAAITFAISPAYGIVVEDNPQLHVVTAAPVYDMVGSYGGASAVLIDPTHALTAAHVAESAGLSTLQLDLPGGRKGFSVSSYSVCPTADLAILTLSQSTGLSGFPLYSGRSEAGQVATLLGYGVSGSGCSDPSLYPTGTERVGWNRIAAASSGTLYTVFHSPASSSSLGATKEASAAVGDSGGALLITVAGQVYLAGIHSSITDFTNGPKPPYYGDYELDVRLSSYLSWIDGSVRVPPAFINSTQLPTISTPEPASMALLALGGLGLLRRNRK